jgi:hypothetical protein
LQQICCKSSDFRAILLNKTYGRWKSAENRSKCNKFAARKRNKRHI